MITPEKESTVPTCRDTMIYPDRAPLLLKKDSERIATGHTPSPALIQDPRRTGGTETDTQRPRAGFRHVETPTASPRGGTTCRIGGAVRCRW